MGWRAQLEGDRDTSRGALGTGPVQEEESEAEERALGPAVSTAGSVDKLAAGLDGSRPEKLTQRTCLMLPQDCEEGNAWRKRQKS